MSFVGAVRPIGATAKTDLSRFSKAIFDHQWPWRRPQYPPPPNNNKTTRTINIISMRRASVPSHAWRRCHSRERCHGFGLWVDNAQRASRQIVPESSDGDLPALLEIGVLDRLKMQVNALVAGGLQGIE
jgi:hypothetical protein